VEVSNSPVLARSSDSACGSAVRSSTIDACTCCRSSMGARFQRTVRRGRRGRRRSLTWTSSQQGRKPRPPIHAVIARHGMGSALPCLGVVLSACLSITRPQYVPILSEVVAEPGLSIDRPAAILDPAGLRFHGWICRRWTGGAAPTRLRLERLAATGHTTAFTYGTVHVPERSGCTVYDIPTDWRFSPLERVMLCVADRDRGCPARER